MTFQMLFEFALIEERRKFAALIGECHKFAAFVMKCHKFPIQIMVKGVVGEETQLKLAEDRLSQSSLPSQVGLVIGKLSSSLDRGFVFDLIPTPFNDDGEPACSIIESSVISRDDNSKKKGSSSKPKSSQSRVSSLSIDKDWVAEHARQLQ
ncbi:hypothetical protein LguiB_020617 [Lonicera macranthoides]